MPRKKSQAKKLEVHDGLVKLRSNPSVINIGSSVGKEVSAINELLRTTIPNIDESGRDTQVATNRYMTSARHKREVRRSSERSETGVEKELEGIRLSKTYTRKAASFESLRIMDWSRNSECWDHDSEECWYHKQINCTNHRKLTHFSHPIRYPLALGKGLEIGLCKGCKRDKRDCSVSNENDRFYGLSDSLANPPVIHRINTSQGELVEGKVDMRVLVNDSDGDEGKDEDEDEDKREGRRFGTPRLATTTLNHGTKRRRRLDPDSDLEEDLGSHCLKSNISQMNRVKRRLIVSPTNDSVITIQAGNDHDDQDPSSTLRSSACLISDSALPDTITAEDNHPDLPWSTFTYPSTSTRTLAGDEPNRSHFASIDEVSGSSNNPTCSSKSGSAPIRHHIPTAVQSQVTRLKNKLRDQGERLDKMMKDKEVIMAKLGQVFMERDEAVRERNELAGEVDRLREILGDTKR
ncbi:hypothetical protein V866_001299 [Kwoniella sp. B9012]